MEPIQKKASGIMVAMYLPTEVAESIARPDGESPEDLHVTIAYLPGLGEDLEAFDALEQALEPVARAYAPVVGKIGGIGRFNASDASDGQDVYYASYNSPGLPDLHGAIINAVEQAGYQLPRKHGFTPHVTLKYVDPTERTPVDRKETEDFPVGQISIASRKHRRDLPLTGVRKSQPGGSEVHVDSAGSEDEKDKPQFPQAAPVPQDTSRSDQVVPPTINNLETEILKEGIGADPHLQFLLKDIRDGAPPIEVDPATSEDAEPRATIDQDTGMPQDQLLAMVATDQYWSDESTANAGNLEAGYPSQGAVADRLEDNALQKSAKPGKKVEKLSAPILKSVAKKRIVYGAVLIPNEVDEQGDWMTEDDIEETAHNYLRKARKVGADHAGEVASVPVESFITREDKEYSTPYGPQKIPKGSWILGVKVLDNKIWDKIESGDYQAFSIGGQGMREPALPPSQG